ncbi:dihydrodipicolinate synthase family protein [Telluribacter sp. SYSU D00476]|uniref:dihydrodipicolinate synthase family protein n=1 Tax=Telluribacter sp. SYSU D00476 TaxID=2811430 RepID=UPI001FF4A1D2|nr:dihydrodipicolinate synthase family protein [Telluribacter sp. SYSU D00476]
MLQSMKLPDGLWPVMLTPFTKTNEVDLDGLERLTEFYIEAGSNGLFANCLSSEMYQLTEEERLLVTSQVVKKSGERVPVVATGTFSRSVAENVAFIKKIHDTGVQAVILITSMLAEPDESEEVLRGRLEQILEQTGQIPLGVYECPVPYKRLLSPALMQWMAQTGRFLYHKDTSCHSGALERKAQAIGGTDFNLYNADTTTALDSLDAGANGISPISANYYPEPYRYLLDQYQQYGRSEEVTRLHAMLTMMDRVTHTYYPYAAKVFLQRRGLKIETSTRIPCETMPQVDRLRFQALMDSFQALAAQHGFPLVLQPVHYTDTTASL